jgi:hypothetical protein
MQRSMRHATDNTLSAAAQEIPAMLSFVAGGFAGLVAQTLTQPLHVVRRRMQVEVRFSARP